MRWGKNMSEIRVGILGSASYASGELIKCLVNHPNVRITYLVSETYTNKIVSECHLFLKDMCDVNFSALDINELKEKCDLVFMSKPHKYSSKHMSKLLDSEIKVIDLSGDFRLKDHSLYKKWYGFEHENPDIIKQFEYGLCELNRDRICNSQYIANPGCYPTSIILGIAPLIKNNLIEFDKILIDSISGVSGAGKSPKDGLMFVDMVDNIKPYKIGTHQHQPEIEQELSGLTNGDIVNVLFVPHVGSFKIGILSTIFCHVKESLSWEDINSCYNDFYKDEVFIRLFEENQCPDISTTEGTNFCDIGFYFESNTNTCVVTSIIDNTIKGAAGQAIQNFNIMYGFPEYTGLPNENLIKKRFEKKLKTIYNSAYIAA